MNISVNLCRLECVITANSTVIYQWENPNAAPSNGHLWILGKIYVWSKGPFYVLSEIIQIKYYYFYATYLFPQISRLCRSWWTLCGGQDQTPEWQYTLEDASPFAPPAPGRTTHTHTGWEINTRHRPNAGIYRLWLVSLSTTVGVPTVLYESKKAHLSILYVWLLSCWWKLLSQYTCIAKSCI